MMKNDNNKKSLAPKLRFPQFRDTEGWDVGELGKMAEFVTERISGEEVEVANYISTENILPDYGGVTTASKLPATGSATRFRPNDTLVSNIRPYLKKVWFSNKDGGASNDVIVIRAKHKLLAQYFPFLLKNDAFIDYVMAGAKGVKMPRGDIASMKKYPTFFPSPAEQQKIADCLTSLDELIAAHGRKLAALRAHKKGLMQQLFPRQGETAPRLRFPEFRGKGEWVERTLGDACRMQAGQFVRAKEINGLPAAALFPCYGGNGLRGYTRTFTHEGIYPLIGRQGALCGNVKIGKGKFHATEHAVVATPNQGIDVVWLYYVLDFLGLNRYATGQAQPGLSVEVLEKVPVTIPAKEAEQHRIADCLSSLDEQLAAQARKLAALQRHKQGLMQRLFPAPEDEA